jgi:hypothetical protein
LNSVLQLARQAYVRLRANGPAPEKAADCAGEQSELSEQSPIPAPAPPPARPAPPPGVRLFFELENAKLCWPEEAHHWTWEGAPAWYYAREHPPPASTPALAPHVRRRCPSCSGRALRVQWQVCKNGERRLQVKCNACEAHAAYLPMEPRNPDLEWRAT